MTSAQKIALPRNPNPFTEEGEDGAVRMAASALTGRDVRDARAGKVSFAHVHSVSSGGLGIGDRWMCGADRPSPQPLSRQERD